MIKNACVREKERGMFGWSRPCSKPRVSCKNRSTFVTVVRSIRLGFPRLSLEGGLKFRIV